MSDPSKFPCSFLSNNPDPDKIHGDRRKLLDEGVFALNKFMLSIELPTWKVCRILGVLSGSRIW